MFTHDLIGLRAAAHQQQLRREAAVERLLRPQPQYRRAALVSREAGPPRLAVLARQASRLALWL